MTPAREGRAHFWVFFKNPPCAAVHSASKRAPRMAIYSVHLGRVGRSTHRAGTAGAHARYVVRKSAASVVLGEHMPTGCTSAKNWLNRQEEADRKNARVIEKIRVALPRELHPLQQQRLIRRYVQRMTGGRAPWLAGIHDKGKDAHNPHAHIIIRDRDIETGRRVAELSEKGSCERLRSIWEEEANRALEEAGIHERIDHRSLKDQGIIDRLPLKHLGAAITALEGRGIRAHRGDENRAINALNEALRVSNDNKGGEEEERQQRQSRFWAEQQRKIRKLRYRKKLMAKRKSPLPPCPKKQAANETIEAVPKIIQPRLEIS